MELELADEDQPVMYVLELLHRAGVPPLLYLPPFNVELTYHLEGIG